MNSSSGNYSITTDGLRYRFKRSYFEMYSSLSNQSKEMQKEEEAKLTSNILFYSHLNSNNDNNNTCLNLKHIPPTPTNQKIQPKQHGRMDNTLQSKAMMIQLSSQLYSIISSLDTNFTSKKIPLLVNILIQYCNKIIKKQLIGHQKGKTNFEIEKRYSDKTKEINPYLLLIDTLRAKNIFYESLLKDNSKIGNLLLYYLSQTMLIDIGKKVISAINFNIDKSFNNAFVMTFSNPTTVKNKNENDLLNNMFDKSLKYYKLLNESSDYYDGLNIHGLLTNFNAEKALSYSGNDVLFFNYDNDIWLKELLNEHPSYFVNQFDFNIHKKLIEYEHKLRCDCITRDVQMNKIKHICDNNTIKIWKSIFKCQVYYVNTLELITDYLFDL